MAKLTQSFQLQHKLLIAGWLCIHHTEAVRPVCMSIDDKKLERMRQSPQTDLTSLCTLIAAVSSRHFYETATDFLEAVSVPFEDGTFFFGDVDGDYLTRCVSLKAAGQRPSSNEAFVAMQMCLAGIDKPMLTLVQP